MTAYKDVGGTLTIGYGHTGSDVKEGMTITDAHATALLLSDVQVAVKAVNQLATKNNWTFTQNEFDALVSFTYNCGSKNLTQLARLGKQHIAERLPMYCHCKGKVLQGLVNRRTEEQKLYVTNVEQTVLDEYSSIVSDVIIGRYGNGNERRVKLAAAGYDYDTVQRLVNKRMKELRG